MKRRLAVTVSKAALLALLGAVGLAGSMLLATCTDSITSLPAPPPEEEEDPDDEDQTTFRLLGSVSIRA